MAVQPEARGGRKSPPALPGELPAALLPGKPPANRAPARWVRHEEIQRKPAQLTQPAYRRSGTAFDPQPDSRGAPFSCLEYVARRRPRPDPAAADCLSRFAAGDEPV